MTGIRFGVNLMPNHWDGQPPAVGPALLDRRQRLLDRMTELGMDHVMVGDHVMFQGGLGNDGLTDAASVVTANAELDVYLAVYLLVLRHPLLVARQLLTVAQLAPGRLSLGVGIGGDDRREVAACGVDPRTRGRRMDEVNLMPNHWDGQPPAVGPALLDRRLLTGESVSHVGEFFTLEAAALRPAVEQPIRIVVGGRSDAALRRAGRFGDGWLGIWTSARRCAEAIETVVAHGKDCGREDVDWRHGMTFWCGFGADKPAARAAVAPVMEGFYRVPFDSFERHIPHGTPAEVADYVAPYVDAGCSDLNFIPYAGTAEAGIDAVAAVRQILDRSS
jgi:alkanesulfonate monooxygenase SsuD/methylene tetrahydromethanopterin reductase-like flavin-dependent oxidoreductase (luciferase family)